MPNLYDLLGVTKDATVEEIRRAYHDCALKYHPDRNRRHEAVEAFLEMQQAYEVLSDPKARRAYDAELAAALADPVRIDVLYSTAALARIGEPQLAYALATFTPSAAALALPPAAMNLALVLDRSTSMQGARMDAVKDAAVELLRRIGAEDRFSLVAFSDRAEILAPSARRPDNRQVEHQILMIRPGGGTEMYQGIEAALGEIEASATASEFKHLILITDGRTYGDEDACLRLAENCALRGIRITGLGIGADWNDIFLDRLAALTGGSCQYVARAGDLRPMLLDRLDLFRKTPLDRAELSLKTSPGVELNSAYRVSPDAMVLPNGTTAALGGIPDSGLSLLLEFKIAPIVGEVSRIQIAGGELEFTTPADAAKSYRMPVSLTLPVSAAGSAGISAELPPPALFQALARLTLYRMQERARQDVSAGKYREAGARLKRLATELLNHGAYELAHTAIVEAERLQQTQMLSAEGEKQIKYGTRMQLPALAAPNFESLSK